MKILLSICIPTLNRADFIGETLNSIITQVNNQVEIVIVDGGSTDDTLHVVMQYQKKFDQIRYFKSNQTGKNIENILPTNKGFDIDCNKAVEFAQGKYCWILPDDDLLKPKAIDTILDQLKYNYSLIIVNSQLMNNNLKHEISNKLLPLETNTIATDLESLFLNNSTYMTYVGCIVIDRNLWISRNIIPYIGKGFIHLGVIFQSPLPRPALTIAEPYIIMRYGNALWSSRAFEIGIINYPELVSSFENLTEETRNKFNMSNPWKILNSIIIFRAKNQYNFQNFKTLSSIKKSTYIFNVLFLLIAIIPPKILNFSILTYLKFINSGKKILIYDLDTCNL